MSKRINSSSLGSRRLLRTVLRDDSGVSAVEYSFLFGLIALVAISTIDGLAKATRASLDRGVTSFDSRGTSTSVTSLGTSSGGVGEPAPAMAAPPEPATAAGQAITPTAPEPPVAGKQPGEPAPMALPPEL